MLTDDFRFAGHCAAFAEQRLKFTPDPWQRRAMQSTSRQLILNCSRQSGKSTTTAAIAVHSALFDPQPGPILLVAPSLRQARELFIKVADFLKDLAPPLDEDNKLSVTLSNGARIVALPGDSKTTRGFSAPRLVIMDEAAFIDDALYMAIRPMLAVSRGKLIIMSTPFGRRGFFFNAWQNGQTWERIEVPASECPRISAEFLEEERAALGDWRFQQEYCCRFVETVDSVFGYDLVMSAMSEDIEPVFGATELAAFGVSHHAG